MRCIISNSSNPYFNLATEEYLLKTSNEEIFLIYINEQCIVVGKHQNLLSEINLPYALENKIKLARRISGGGTVYQDLNNLNFSFIHNCPNLEKLNFTKFTNPVLEALIDMGLDAGFSGRNDLLIDSKKISGNAMHIYKTRVLSHGTLLFDTDLSRLSLALKTEPHKYIDKSIKSVRSKVTNIANYIQEQTSIYKFSQSLFSNIAGKSVNSVIRPLTGQETKMILQISNNKFETWEWIYGYSPKYVFRNEIHLSGQLVMLELQVEKGIIKHVNTNIDYSQNTEYKTIFNVLLNVKHDYKTIFELLENDEKIRNIKSFSVAEFCADLF